MATSSAALLVACMLFAAYDYYTFRRTLAREVTTMADIVGGNSSAALTFNDRDTAREVLGRLAVQESIVSAELIDNKGVTFATFMRRQGTTAPACSSADSLNLTDSAVVVSRPVMLLGERIGTVCVQSNLSELSARLRG